MTIGMRNNGNSVIAIRILNLIGLLLVSWCVMTFTHESGHILAGWSAGGRLSRADLLPWHLPYSFFQPDPLPLVTLWGGPVLGVLIPLAVAAMLRTNWMWFIAHFCVLANGAYIATAGLTRDQYLDTTKLLEHGADPLSIAAYCAVTIGYGYVGFRRQCSLVLQGPSAVGADRKD